MTFNILSIFAGILYIVVGIFVIKYKTFIIQLDANASYAFGAVLILYGIFRMVRAYLQIKNNRNHE
ncbi:DUF308 domain-containing protein [Elizabethkingia sp. JS20170427COW]|uniref:DUF308 domain-containing protein n=1 Tax=Elizabethkingia sp. JS20170427COW TaxID=2583851 RepID=UPI0011109656|nr:DUF308 domain-containing protein [Elizabethkingia sp. JS20170427COW]QCX53397.1 C4-dicarboxylate ABC transporter [Elizabethkingia sp. JS20170427COW]